MPGMLPCVPQAILLPEQRAFADRVASLQTAEDLDAFAKDVTVWLQSPGISNCVAPKALAGKWRAKLQSAPFAVTDGDKHALEDEIKAFHFQE
jgi:hypothetical protein